MKFTVIQTFLLLVAVLVGAGCAGSSGEMENAAPAGDQDSLRVLLQSLDQEALRQAFERLPSYYYTQYQRYQQLAPEGQPIAVREQLYQYGTLEGRRNATVLPQGTSGQFDFGFLDRFVPSGSEGGGEMAIVSILIPDEPPYLSPRTQDQFHFELMPDTVVSGKTARVVNVVAAGEEGADQPIRQARLVFDPITLDVLAMSVTRKSTDLLFREHTHSHVQLAEATPGVWLPDSTSVYSRLVLPLFTARTFQTDSRYSGFELVR
jgi:hypothetical protein